MASIGITVSVSGLEEIEKEAQRMLTAEKCRAVSNAVYADMKEALEAHIVDDVYDAYSPTQYLRRKDHESMGVSLLKSAENAQQIGPFDYSSRDYWVTGLAYEPSGEHENIEWSDVDGDKLISRIEKKDPPYRFEPRKGPKIPKRPFWQLFVEELIESGRLERSVKRELIAQGIAEPSDNITGIIRHNEDGNY